MPKIKFPKRIQILLAFLQELNEEVTNKNIDDLLFLYCHKYTNNAAYHFIMAQREICSIQLEEDLKFLASKDIIDGLVLNQTSERFAIKLDMFDKFGLQKLKNDLGNKSLESFDQAWDEYFIAEPMAEKAVLYTIGYEGISLEQYINKLVARGVKCLCDVRRNPFSQKYGFSKAGLQDFLSRVGIQYVHIPELGIASNMRSELGSELSYYKLLRQYETELLPKCGESIERLEKLLKQYGSIAITCFEANVSHCHRSKIANLMRDKNDWHDVRDI